LGVAAVVCLLYLLRLRQMTARVRGRLEERLEERERIARELHDTLLQGMQGLILRFHGLSQRAGIDKPERAAMNDALDSAQRALVDARDRVTGLRESTLTTPGLLESLTRVGESLAHDHACTLQATIQGEAIRLHPVVFEEVQRIGAEALANAFHHAQANRVELDIQFDRAELRLRIRDDGRGFELATLEAANRQGHWGLTGMRERAHKIRGRIDIWSRPGAGTEIDLRIPAAMAYHDPVPRSRLGWLQRIFRERESL
jgi:signal transduction histidine kinase